MASARFDEVQISDRGGLRPRRLVVANVACSWELSAPGSFSAFARIADLRAAGLWGSLAGRWLTWAHPTAGAWGGVLSGRPVADGVAELTAEGWATLLRGRVLAPGDRGSAGPAASLALRAVLAAGNTGATFVRAGAIDEGGEAVDVEFAGDACDDVLPALAATGDAEWTFDADRTFRAGRRLGRDRSQTVRLVEDRHVVSFRVDDDLWTARPGALLAAVGPQAQALATVTEAPAPAATAAATGPLAFLADFALGDLSDLPWTAPPGAEWAEWADQWDWAGPQWPGEGPEPAPGPGLPPWQPEQPPPTVPPGVGGNSPGVPGGRFSPPRTVPVELTLADADGCWAWFGLGDTVRVELGSVGFAGRFRVLARAVDAASGEMTAAGECLPDARGVG